MSIKKLTWLGVGAFVVASAFLAWNARVDKLEFVELASPAGFRQLVLAGAVSPVQNFLWDVSPTSVGSATGFDPGQLYKGLFCDRSSPTVGNDERPIRVVTFFDYRCPYCRKLTRILSELQNDGRIQIVYKEWPILGESSVVAARAALAAAKQGQYPAFHMRLMETEFVPTRAYVEAVASELGLDQAQLLADMNAGDVSAAIDRAAALASAFNFVGTPALVVGRTVVQGSITRSQLEQLIADEAVTSAKHAC